MRLLSQSVIMKKYKTVVVSGGFDCLHFGHIEHFEAARKLGDKLIVILNSDDFLKRKKGFVFMPFEERKRIIESFRMVDWVVPCIDDDQTVSQTLRLLRLLGAVDIYANGGDRTGKNVPEADVCKELGIKMVSGVGGRKAQSSSELVRNAIKQLDSI